MVQLREINEENFDDCISLEVEEAQKRFVARNVYSLAQAWLYPHNARPFGICDDGEMVGFLMLDIDYHRDGSKSVCEIWRLMIDDKQQGKGYGKEALLLAIAWARDNCNPKKMRLSYVPGNAVAEGLYASLGFVPTGELDGDEIVMELDIS